MTAKRIVIVLIAGAVLAGGALLASRWGRAGAEAGKTPAATAKAERGPIRLAVASTGRVISNLDVDIKCRASGEVVKLPKDVSDPVRVGDLLFELDPTDMQRNVDRAKSALAEATARAKYARLRAERLKQTMQLDLSSRDEYDAADATALQNEAQVEAGRIALADAEQQRGYCKVVSPIDGVVSARNVQVGTIIASGINNVGGGTTVLTISDLSRIFVVASVDESDIGKVAVGQPVAVTADAFPGRKFGGKVVQIATKGINASNVVTFEVKIEVLDPQRPSAKGEMPAKGEPSGAAEAPPRGGPGANRGIGREGKGEAPKSEPAGGKPAGRDAGRDGARDSRKDLLKPEMTANVEIVAAEKADALTVPAEAVARQRGKQVVKVLASPGAEAQEREVEVGINDGAKIEILKGLAEGEVVVLNKSANSRWQGAQQGQRPGGPPMMMGGPPRR